MSFAGLTECLSLNDFLRCIHKISFLPFSGQINQTDVDLRSAPNIYHEAALLNPVPKALVVVTD